MTTIKGRIAETIYPNGTGAITAEKHQALLLEMVDDINEKKADKEEVTAVAESVSTLSQEVESNRVNLTESINALEQKVDNLPQGEEFDAEGNYPSLRVGTADTAIDLAGRGESVPAEFGFRASGGKSIKDGRAYIKRIKGNSVVWNQLWDINGDNRTDNAAIKAINESEIVLTLQDSGANSRIRTAYTIGVVGHKYYVTYQAKYNSKSDDSSLIAFVGMSNSYGNQLPLTNSYQTYSGIWVGDYAGSMSVGVIGTRNDGDIVSFKDIKVIDLTQLFQAGNEPTTFEEYEARKPIVADEYAYNEGQVIHCNTESIKSVGDNAWDEEWIAGRLSTNTGQPNLGNNGITSKNYIRVLPNETYYCGYNAAPIFAMFYDAEYALITGVNGSNNFVSIRNTQFTTPANAAYMKLYVADNNITTYNHDIMITLVHSGWKQDTDAGYQPYWQDTLPLPIIRKYFPDGMKSAGSAHDEIRYNKASGKWEYSKGKIKSVDLGTLNWGLAPQMYFRANLPSDSIIPTGTNYNGFLCAKYERVNFNLIYGQSVTTPCFGVSANNGMIGVYDSAYTDAATFKAAMQGVILYYEAADWEWVELDAEDQNFRDYYNVADFGTEQSQSSVPSAPFSADIIYQFNAVDMIREHEIEITELQSIIATMQAQLTSLINGGQ